MFGPLLPRLARLRHRLASPLERLRLLCLGTSGAIVVVVEVFGRRGTNELHDLLAITGLVVAGMLVAFAHRLRGLRPIRALRGVIAHAWRIWRERSTLGVDLRGAPQVAPGVPLLRRCLLPFAVGMGLTIGAFAWFDVSLREVARNTLYLPFALGTVVMWLATVAATLGGALLVLCCVHDWILVRRPDLEATIGRATTRITLPVVAAALIGAALVSPLVPIALALACCACALRSLGRGRTSELRYVWRDRHGELRSTSYRDHVPSELGLLLLLWLVPVAMGFSASGPISNVLAEIAAWVGGFGVAVVVISGLAWLRVCRGDDPARPSPPTLHVDGELREPARVAASLDALGMRIRAVREPAAEDDVRVELRSAPPRADERGWPWPVVERDLEQPSFVEFLTRRDAAQCRSRLLDVVEESLRSARERRYESGIGFWIAPHLWYVAGLARDDSERDEQTWLCLGSMIGRPWHELLSHHVRHHFWVVMRSLEVDLIFVEDGVAPDVLRSVLERLFEHYDWAPDRRLEERDLHGIRGARPVLHEVGGSGRLRRGYPEPDYDEIGRARVLHVFRDRGGEEAEVEEPDEGIRLPKLGPMLVSF